MLLVHCKVLYLLVVVLEQQQHLLLLLPFPPGCCQPPGQQSSQPLPLQDHQLDSLELPLSQTQHTQHLASAPKPGPASP
jgi:hypothetical protein